MDLLRFTNRLFEQYKASLKVVEIEEVFDLILYRPLAFIFVKATYSTNLTPNQVSVLAMLFGVIGGILFGFGSREFLLAGAAFYLTCNILDCADGQIARLKNNGTKVGRIVDGFIDYVVSTVVYFGIGIGLTNLHVKGALNLHFNIFELNPYVYIWIVIALAGFSSAFQAISLDFFRNKYLEYVYGKFSSLEEEFQEFEEEKARINKPGVKKGTFDNFLISVYLKYTRFQIGLQAKKKAGSQKPPPDPKSYYRRNKILIHFWSYIGSTTHLTLCLLSALLNNMELFLIICILPLNFVMLVLYFTQRAINSD
jgi:phosphatidylglycerophosphate synthase